MQHTLLKTVGALLVILAVAGPCSADSTGPLRVSDNGRYLLQADGAPFFAIADTAWAIAWQLDRDEVDDYLTHRKEQGFNTIGLVAFPSYDGARIVPNAYGDFPFAVESDMWVPGQPLTTDGDDPSDDSAYDYWDHLAYIVDAADARGMIAVVLPSWGAYVAGKYVSGAPTNEIVFDTTSAYRYGHWIAQRLANRGNIVWMMGGDRSAVYGERDYRPVFRAMAEGVADGINGVDQPDGEADYTTTIMSYHPRKWQPNSSEWFHSDPWLDFNSMQDQPKDQIAATALDYSLTPAKPTWLFEGGYEARHRGDESYGDWQIRFQSYQTVFAGGFGVTYGSMNVFHFNGDLSQLDEQVGDRATSAWRLALDEPGAEDMIHLYRLMTGWSAAQYVDRIPDPALIDGDGGTMTGSEGAVSTCIVATRGGAGDYAMVYAADGRTFGVHMDRLAAGTFSARWFDPREGTWQDGAAAIPGGPAAPVATFDPPGEPGAGNDWVLVLTAVG